MVRSGKTSRSLKETHRMATRRPPHLATRLLLRLPASSRRESLLGDLEERFRQGRSRSWYWWQVLAAFTGQALTEIGDHKLLAAGTAIVVWIVVVGWVEGTWWLYGITTHRWPILNRSTFWLWYGGGLQLIWCLGAALTGSVAARVGGRLPTAKILVALVAIFPLAVWWGGPWLIRFFQTDAWYRVPQLVFALSVLVGMPMCTLFGWLLARPPSRVS